MADWRKYRDTKTCSCGATFFGLVEEADQWAVDHLNEGGDNCKLMLSGPMLPPLDLRVVEPPSVLSQSLEEIEANWESSHREILRRVRNGD